MAFLNKIDFYILYFTILYYISLYYMISPLKFIEVCSGGGGLSQGFIHDGFVPVILNDFDKTCCDTLHLNHPNVPIICDSFVNIDFSKFADIDVFMGGVPCQSFSQAGKRKGFDDTRGNLLLDFIDRIPIVNPKVFLIENVKGLLTHNNGATFDIILSKLKNIGSYVISYKVLNANNYNVPQKRERLFIIGVHNSIDKPFVFPNELPYKPILRDVFNNLPPSDGYSYPLSKKNIMDLVPPGGCWVDLPLDIQKSYMKKSFLSGGGKRGIARRLSLDAPSLTLTTSPCQKQTERCHPVETRPLNIAEYARIQTFPDTYLFSGSLANRYKQIGNAVPVNLAIHIAKAIRDILS